MDRQDSCDRGWEPPGGASLEESDMAATAMVAEAKRTCADCGTSKTPLWRGGPAGPKSLCNACGIRSRKKRRAILGLEDKKPRRISPGGTKNNNHASSGNHPRGVEIGGILAISKHVATPRSSTEMRPKKKMGVGEEEQAAKLLMALSYGTVYCFN